MYNQWPTAFFSGWNGGWFGPADISEFVRGEGGVDWRTSSDACGISLQTGLNTLLKLTVWDKLGLLQMSTVTCTSSTHTFLTVVSRFHACSAAECSDIGSAKRPAIPPCPKIPSDILFVGVVVIVRPASVQVADSCPQVRCKF